MVKFKQFADFLIGTGLVSEGGLTHLRRVLRGAGLVSSGGQGFASAALEVADVTNIFLSIVAADQIKNAPDVVRLYRSATIDPTHSVNIDPWPFIYGGIDWTLGEALDCFFEGLLQGVKYPGLPWTNMSFEFDIVDGKTSADASMWLDDGDLGHTLKFGAFDPVALSRIKAGDGAFIYEQMGGIFRRATVGDEFLLPIAEFVVENLFPENPDEDAE